MNVARFANSRAPKPTLSRRLRFEPLEGRRLLATLFRINAGGPEISGSPDWQADTLAAPSSFSNAASGGNSGTFATTAAINMTHASIPAGTPMSLFQDERFDKPTGANLLWDFPVTAGQYEVRLYFAETWSGAFTNGVRVFDVTIEGVTVLDNYDVFADVGGNKGVVKSFIVNSDGNLDIDFLRGVQNPTIKAIEILSTAPAPGTLTPSATALNFGTVAVGQSSSQSLTLTNSAAAGGPSITISPGAVTVTPSGQPFTVNWGQSTPIVLAPGQSKQVTVNYAPTAVALHAATLTIPHNGAGSPLQIALSGTAGGQVPISFAKSVLGNTTGLDRPTSIQFGPDGRLYVAQQNGLILAYTVVKTAANDYDVTAVENITHIQQITNHNDDGALAPTITTRLVTGILVTGTAANPVMYVNSSDPRIGGGSTGADLNLDTNSSTVSRLTKSGATWTKVDLVRGLPRSEENHHANGMQLDAATNTLYVAMGGNTNMGATSNNFSFLPEFALSAAILSIDLDAIGNTTYNLPTLDDETRATNNDANDPFGGNDGRNQAIIVPGGPVQVYAPGFRNAYDLLIHSNGKMFTVDNGANAGWGDVPIGEGPNGTATNGVNEPGVSYGDGLHHITGPGYYGGHPNPTRANRNNTFNTSNPQSPVPAANPIEGDFRAPGAENGSLVVFPTSSNGIVEYTTNNFGGAMKGDILVAVFDNTIKRVKLNAAGQVVLSENLFTNVGFRPLDITAPATGPFAGTLWVCDVAQGTITVFEPTTGGGGDPDDLDGDGYTNADEIANGTDPNSPADVPPDADVDFISDLSDPNDDNDGFPDTTDKFAVDAQNGSTTPIGTQYGWENEGANLGGILGMGFTGLMTNGTSNYASLFDPNKVTAGGAAGVFTIDSALSGTAKAAANTQQQAFQFGVNVGGATSPFVARTSIIGPFNGLTPQVGQEMGFYIGTGDQDNFIQIVLSGDNGGSIKLGKEIAGSFTTVASQNLSMSGSSFVDLRLTIDPVADTLQASYSVGGGAFVNLGGAVAVPASWIASAMAVGLIATDPTGSGDLPVTWDYLGVQSTTPVTGDPKALFVVEGLGGTLLTASVFGTGSFKITNQSTGNVRIQSVTIDTRTAILPDLVFDPLGDGGNDVFKPFTPDQGAALTGLVSHSHASEHGGGFDTLTINFNEFDPGEQFVFSIDMEPTTIKGSVAPGPSHAGKVSGLEMTGSTITVVFNDGTTTTSQTYRTAGNNRASQTIADTGLPPTPGLMLLGSVTPPANVSTASQTVRITGPAGATARLLHLEASLHLAGVPGGGFDIDPFEANKASKLTEKTVTIGAGGFVDVPIVLSKGEAEGGYNYITAVIQDAQGRTGGNATDIVLKYNPGGLSNPSDAAGGDFTGDGQVDGADFLTWQRALGSTVEPAGVAADGSGDGVVNADDLAVWQDGFGAVASEATAGGGSGSSASLLRAESVESSGIDVDLSRLWSAQGSVFGWALTGESREVKLADKSPSERSVSKPPADRMFAVLSTATNALRFVSAGTDDAENEVDGFENVESEELDELDLAFAALT